MNNFTPFDPLKAKSVMDTEVAALAQKREIKNLTFFTYTLVYGKQLARIKK